MNRKADIDFSPPVIAPGTVLYTDGDPLQRPADHVGIIHETDRDGHVDGPAHERSPPCTESRRCSNDGSPAPSTTASSHHIAYYLDEFTFRFNRRTSRSRGLLFYRLFQQAVNTEPHPLDDLLAWPPTHSDDWS